MGEESSVRLRDGRMVSCGVWGARGGAPVFGFHGGGLSRLQHYGDEAPAAAGVRLILPDRPGCGRADPHPGGSLLDWADDVRQLADELGAGRFAVFGVSAGGPFALACGYALPGRVTVVGLVSAVGGCYVDDPELAGFLRPPARELVRLAARDPQAAAMAAAQQCREEARTILADPGALIDSWPPGTPESDRELMARPDIRARFTAALEETASRGPAGELLDTLLTYTTPWGFRPGDVQPPVHLWHGTMDTFVPIAIARAMAARIPGSTLTEYPGEGHTVDYRHIGDILSSLAAAR